MRRMASRKKISMTAKSSSTKDHGNFAMTTAAKPRYKDAKKRRFYDALLASAADLTSEMYHQGRPHRGAGHRTAFWDGYAGLTRTANVIPGTRHAPG